MFEKFDEKSLYFQIQMLINHHIDFPMALQAQHYIIESMPFLMNKFNSLPIKSAAVLFYFLSSLLQTNWKGHSQNCWQFSLTVWQYSNTKRKKEKVVNHPICIEFSFNRYWREWKEHLYQTNENYPWRRILRGGQEELCQTGLPEHLHVHADHDPSHGDTQYSFLWFPEPGTVRVGLLLKF